MKTIFLCFSFFVLCFAQDSRETLISYINTKLDAFSGKTDVGYVRYFIDIDKDNQILVYEHWYINNLFYSEKKRPRETIYTFSPDHIESVALSEENSGIYFHLKEAYYRTKSRTVVKEIILSLSDEENTSSAENEYVQLKNSFVFLFRNLMNQKL